jgi:hypothetical protein
MRRTGTTIAAVNLRKGPGTEHAILTALKPRTSVDIIEQEGYWLHVNAGEREGYVHSKFVFVEEEKGVPEGFLKEKVDTAASTTTAAAAASTTTTAGAVSLAEVPMAVPDAEKIIVDPKAPGLGLERLVANTWNRYGGLLTVLSEQLQIDPAVAVAVLAVESGGRGFGPDGRMLIRFENQIFFDKWGRNNADRYFQHFTFNQDKRWMEHKWRPAPDQGWREFHGNQAAEWEVLNFAKSLNDTAAKLSISMGGPQIMGFNYAMIGYESVQQMFDAFAASERNQVIAFFDFVQGAGTTSRRIIALQERDFNTFASMYNGPGQAGKYGSLIRNVFDAFHRLKSGQPA